MSILSILSPIVFFVTLALPAMSKDMTFDIIYLNHTNIVVADGEITKHTPDDFQKFLDAEPFDGFSFLIDLNSPGGNLMGGIELGRLIREQGLTSRVASYRPRAPDETYWPPREEPGICMSACALAYLGGEDRELNENSILGFHQFSSAGNASGKVADLYETEATTQVIAGIVHDYIVSMGISPTLFSRMSLTLPEEMYIPTEQELLALNILPVNGFSDFILEPYADGVIAHSTFAGNVEGRNIVSGIAAYCRGGTPYLLLSQPDNYRPLDSQWIETASKMLDGFSLWASPGDAKIDYPPSYVEFQAGGQPVAEIRIDARGVKLLTEGARGNVQLPGALGNSMYFEITPTEADKKILSGAFTLCIEGDQGDGNGIPESESGQAAEELVGYYNLYLSDWSRENSVALIAMDRVYGSEINFYGATISKEKLMREKRKFAENWPQRLYTARPDSFEVSCSAAACVVAASIDWYAHNPISGKSASGEARYELGFDLNTGLIISENGESKRH